LTGISTNVGALLARTYWVRANYQMQTSLERLSSGLRINNAADDAAGLAVSNKMLAAIRSYSVGVRNTHDMIGLLKTAESALEEAENILLRIKELSIQSVNGIYTNADRELMQRELITLRNEINKIGENTKFNGIKLFDGLFKNRFAQTGKNSSERVRVDINKFGSPDLGRTNVIDSFSNGEFGYGNITEIATDVYALNGWEIHNKRVELGEDGSEGPLTILNRDGEEIPNLIGGWAIPEDPTPRPFNNDVPVFVAPAVSSTTNDEALTYNTTYAGIVDGAPPDVSNPGTWNVTTGQLTSVSMVSGGTTNKTSLMGVSTTAEGTSVGHDGDPATFNVVIGPMTTTQQSGFTTNNTSMMGKTFTGIAGSVPTNPAGDPALFNVTVGAMTVTQNTSTTTNLGMMDRTWTDVLGSSPDGLYDANSAVFDVTVGEMNIDSITGATTTENTTRMGRTFTNVQGETDGHAAADNAAFTVTIGAMTVTPTEGTTTENSSMMGQAFNNVAGTGPDGHVGDDATFNITVGPMTVTPTEGSTTNNPSMMGQTFNDVGGTGPGGHVGDDATFNVTVGPMTVTLINNQVTSDAERFGRSYTNISASPPNAGGANDSSAKFDVSISAAGAVSVSMVDAGSGYTSGETITIKGSLIGGLDGVDDLSLRVNDASVSVTLVDPGSGYTTGDIITIPGTSIGGTADDFVKVRVGDANVSVTLVDPGSGYTTGDIITIPGTSIGGAADDFVKVRVGAANISVNMTDAGANYSNGDTITIAGETIGGSDDGSDDIVLEIGPADILVTLKTPKPGYTAGDTIVIRGEDIGGGASDDVLVTVNNATVAASLATPKPGYLAPEIITISGTSIDGDASNDIQMRVNSANITVTVNDPGTNFEIGEEIRILGSDIDAINGEDGVDDVVVKGNATTISATATSGLAYTIGDQITLSGDSIVTGADDVVTVVELVPPGNDDSKRPRDYGDLEDSGSTGGVIVDGFLKLNDGLLTAVNAYDIVHGPYLISDEAKYIDVGEKVFFDWKASGTNDAYDIFAYVLNVDTGETQILLDKTQNEEGVATDWVTVETVIEKEGNYKFVFVNGTYDATGGKKLGAELYLDNIYIDNDKIPPLKQHTINDISLLTKKEADNAVSVVELALSQTSTERAKIGALINRLDKSLKISGSIRNNLTQAQSRVLDADYTIETVKLAKQNILGMAASQMLENAIGNKKNLLLLLE